MELTPEREQARDGYRKFIMAVISREIVVIPEPIEYSALKARLKVING